MIKLADIVRVLEVEPLLTYGGFAKNEDGAKGNCSELADHLSEIQLCYDWLKRQNIGQRVGAHDHSSYLLKHAVEAFADTYVSNGAFLCAAIIANVPYKRIRNTPNAFVAVRGNRQRKRSYSGLTQRQCSYSKFNPFPPEYKREDG